MNRLVSRSLEILGHATKEIGNDYTSNLTAFINDAKNVKDSIVKSTTDASDTFAKLKTTNITKKISDWFYQEENSYDAMGDEFDPGFKVDSSDDDAKLDGDKTPTILNADNMSSIMDKQSNMLVKIGRRQNEQSIVNTAEIVSVLNSRTSEMITSMNNINKTLLGINEKLDNLIKIQTIETKESNSTEDKSGIYDSSGNLSLMRIFEQAKQNVSNNTVFSLAQSFGQVITNGGRPEDVAKMLIGFMTGKPINALGGMSIDAVGKQFNDMIGTAIQTGMNEAIKSGPFQALFGNIAQFEGDKDYGTIADNNYNTKKAVFDGMTRMSIVNIIPEYLSKITEALSGETWHTDNRGRLVKGPVQNKFNEVTRNAFASSGISYTAQNKILEVGKQKYGDRISDSDITEAGKALCGAIVMYKHYTGNDNGAFTVSDLSKDMSPYIISAVKTLCNTPGRNDPEYWSSVCQMIVMQLSSGVMDASQFVHNVNVSLDNLKRSAIEIAKSGKPEALQAGKLTQDMMNEQWILTHQNTDTTTQTTTPTTENKTENKTDGNKIGRVDKYYIDGKHTTGDFIRGIFGILNRGINVRVLNKKDQSWKFGDYDLERQTVKQEIVDNKAAELFGSFMANGGKDKNIGDIIREGYKQAMDSFKNGDGKESGGGIIQGAQQGFMGNMLSFLGASSMKEFASKFVNGDYKGFFKEGGKGKEFLDSAKGKATDLFDNARKQVSDTIGTSPLTMDKRIKKATSKTKDFIVGEEGVVDKGKNLFNKASDVVTNTSVYQNARDKISQTINNVSYNKDQMTLNSATGSLNNIDTSAIENFEDRMSAETALMYFKDGNYDEARIEANKINNKRIRKYIDERIKKVQDIKEKREKGQEALENGETPDIGATLQSTTPSDKSDKINGADDNGNPVLKILKKGFSLIGKWFEKSAKLIGDGTLNITFGLKTLASGIKQSVSIIGGSLKTMMKPFKEAIVVMGKNIKNSISDAFSKVNDVIGKLKFDGFNKEKSEKKSIGERVGDVIRGSGTFGASFMTGFDEAREAKKKLSEAQERASSFVNRSVGDIMDVITGKKSVENSPFNQLIDIITEFKDDVNGNHEEDVKQAEENKKAQATEGSEEGEGPKVGIHNIKDAVSAVKGTDGGAGGMKGLVEGIGKSLGGMTQILLGIGEAALGVVMGMEGFKALMNIGTELLQDILEPLDQLFKVTKNAIESLLKPLKDGLHDIVQTLTEIVTSVIDILKPIFDMVDQLVDVVVNVVLDIIRSISGILNSIVGLLSTVIESIVDLLVPLLEVISDVINLLLEMVLPVLDIIGSAVNAIISILNPILELISVILEVALVPILLVLDVLQPIIEYMGNCLKVISGVLQLGMGIIIGILGSMLKGIGLLISAFGSAPIVGNSATKELGASIESTADGMLDSSKSLISGGIEQMAEGLSGIVALAKSIIKPITGEEEQVDNVNTESDTSNVKLNTTDFGAGDVNTNTINNSWTYTYGSGNTTMNQHSYGGYMNMSERGCGPVVLADAYNRRNGGKMSPVTVASAMMGSGTYDPRRGTSVGSMIDTGNAMGLGMRMGGVTQKSLKQASPNNPITILGSGSGFGTKSGNNHYVNVIGTDKNGGAYVANPLSGRVERQSANDLVLNSKLGLYGSGDENEYAQYGFSDELSESFNALKELTDQLTGIFQGPSKGDEINEKRAQQKDAQNAATIKQKLSEEEYSAIEQEARNKLQADNPKRDGESDESYQARIEKLWAKKGNSLIVQLGGQTYADKISNMAELMSSGASEMQSAHNKMSEGMHAASGASLDTASAKSFNGAIMASYSPINYIEPEIDGKTSGKSPVHDFFSATSGSSAYTIDGGWFEKSNAPVSKEGVGSTGNAHEGIGITFTNSDSEIHAITEGTVTYVGRGGKHGGEDPNGGLGNHVKWRDKSGMYHWYLHLNDIDDSIEEGSNIEAGQLIGHVGSTGATGEGNDKKPVSLLRYILTKNGPYGSTGDAGYVNPLTYWKFEEMDDSLSGDTEKEQIFNYLVNNIGLSKKAAAGVMGVFQAESGLTASIVEGVFGDNDKFKRVTASNSALDSYTTDDLFPMYARNGNSIDQGAYKGQDGHWYPGFGLAQWTGPRGKNVMDFGKSSGTDWTDLATQLSFIKNELSNDYSYVLDDLNNYGKDDVATAANIWMSQYEAGGGRGNRNPSSTWLSASQISTRQENAKNLYSELENHVVPASNTVDNKDEKSLSGRFISTISNKSSGTDSLLNAVSEVFEAAVNNNGGIYAFSNAGPVTLRDGTTLTNFRQDCSGLMSAAINAMGYDFNAGDSTGIRTYDLYNRNTQDLVTKDGSPSSDWEILPYTSGSLQPGDIITTQEHMSMYISGDDNSSWGNKGFDGGSGLGSVSPGTGIQDSAAAGKAYLDGDSDWASKLHSTHSGVDGLTRILRYVGESNITTNDNVGQHRGGFTNAGIETNVYSGKGPFKIETNTTNSDRGNTYGPIQPSQINGNNKIKKITGSGDTDDWAINTDIPPLDMSNFTQYDSTPIQQFYQKYEVVSDNSSNLDILDKMSKMTFNVRAQRVEELLEELIEKVSNDKPDTPSNPSTNGYDPNLFRNEIPEQVSRLARG